MSETLATAAAVEGFLPSTSAFRFTNDFPHHPVVTVPVPGLGTSIPLGDASRGLCAGMITAVRDLFEAGRTPPPDPTPPPPGSPLFRYLARRLIDSWDLPRGALRYYQLQNMPDADVVWALGRRPGIGRATVVDEWPKVRADLDTGRLSPLGVLTVHSSDPRKLGLNHQVLAYAYDLAGTTVTLRVYDPNTPVTAARADHVTISFDTSDPTGPVIISHNVTISGRPIRGFFRAAYRWADPSAVCALR